MLKILNSTTGFFRRNYKHFLALPALLVLVLLIKLLNERPQLLRGAGAAVGFYRANGAGAGADGEYVFQVAKPAVP
jgi:hypothetical protein